MIHIYHRRRSKSATILSQMVEGTHGATIPAGTRLVVCWGNPIPGGLNHQIIGNKYQELLKLTRGGVRCPESTGGIIPLLEGNSEWIPRRMHHHGGLDIIHPRGSSIAYFTKFVKTIREFRVHIFQGVSIRAGIKLPGAGAHPWIRSHHQGWEIQYGRECQRYMTNQIRAEAKKAVAALGYDFGAVDVGVLENGTPIVFEVNSAPGLDNENTARAYATHILDYYGENYT